MKINSNPYHAFESNTPTDFWCRENAAFLQKPRSRSSQYSLEDPGQSHLFKPRKKPKLIIRKLSFIDKVSNDLKETGLPSSRSRGNSGPSYRKSQTIQKSDLPADSPLKKLSASIKKKLKLKLSSVTSRDPKPEFLIQEGRVPIIHSARINRPTPMTGPNVIKPMLRPGSNIGLAFAKPPGQQHHSPELDPEIERLRQAFQEKSEFSPGNKHQRARLFAAELNKSSFIQKLEGDTGKYKSYVSGSICRYKKAQKFKGFISDSCNFFRNTHEFLKDKIQKVTHDQSNFQSHPEELALGVPSRGDTPDPAHPNVPEAIDSLDHDSEKLNTDSSKKSSNTTISVAPTHRKSSRGRPNSSELSSKNCEKPNDTPQNDSEKREFHRLKSKIERFKEKKTNILGNYLGNVYNLRLGDKIIKIPQAKNGSLKKRLEKLGKEERQVRDQIFDYLAMGEAPYGQWNVPLSRRPEALGRIDTIIEESFGTLARGSVFSKNDMSSGVSIGIPSFGKHSYRSVVGKADSLRKNPAGESVGNIV
jgi:hypothetical protein